MISFPIEIVSLTAAVCFTLQAINKIVGRSPEVFRRQISLIDAPRWFSLANIALVFSRDPTKFNACSAVHYCDPGQFATSRLFNWRMTISPDGFSAEEEFPNNERRASSESDKDSIVNSIVIYLCIQSWTTRAMMFITAMWRNSVYLPYQTTGNLSIALLSKCPINNNLITLQPRSLQLDCQASRINDL